MSDPREYRVDDLAQAAGTSVRNVRVYQDRGLLPPPRRVGRVGLYDQSHLARLRLIGRLLARGYTFATIGELFDAWTRGHDLGEVLGLRGALPTPGPSSEPMRMSKADVMLRLGLSGRSPAVTTAVLGQAVAAGVMTPAGNAFTSHEPGLLSAASCLLAAGEPIETVFQTVLAARDALATTAETVLGRLTAGLQEPDALERADRLRAHLEQLAAPLVSSALRQVDRGPDRA